MFSRISAVKHKVNMQNWYVNFRFLYYFRIYNDVHTCAHFTSIYFQIKSFSHFFFVFVSACALLTYFSHLFSFWAIHTHTKLVCKSNIWWIKKKKSLLNLFDEQHYFLNKLGKHNKNETSKQNNSRHNILSKWNTFYFHSTISKFYLNKY